MSLYNIYRTDPPPCGLNIKQDNPITYALSACQPFNESTGWPVEIISQTIGLVDWGNGYWHPNGIMNLGNTTIDTGVNVEAGMGSFTFMFYGYCNVYDTVLLCSCDTYGDAGFTIVSNSVDGLVQVRVNDVSSVFNTGLYPTTYTNRSQIVGVIDRESNPSLKLYIDGQIKDIISLAGAGNIYNTTSITIGSRNFTYPMHGLMSAVMLQNRGLNANEILSMYENPYQIYDNDIIYMNSKNKPNNQQIYKPSIFHDKFDRLDVYSTGIYDTTSGFILDESNGGT